jgi:hypothetical protein
MIWDYAQSGFLADTSHIGKPSYQGGIRASGYTAPAVEVEVKSSVRHLTVALVRVKCLVRLAELASCPLIGESKTSTLGLCPSPGSRDS